MSNNTENTHFSGQGPPRGVSFRAVLLAVLITVPNSYWLMINWGPSGYSTGQSFPTVSTVYFNVVFVVLVLMALNPLLGTIRKSARLSDAELMAVYLLLSIASSLAGHDTLQILWPLLTYPIWFASPENEWGELFHRLMPDWLTIKDRGALSAFYQGDSSLHTLTHLQLWLPPVLWWSALIIVLTCMMLCFTVLIRHQWVTHEKLSYPVIQIPLHLTERNGGVLLRNRLFLVGAVLAGGINLLNGLHFLFPVVPGLGGSLYNLGQHFQTKPLNAIGRLPVAVYPFAIGMSFFIPLELSFSIWFFYLFHKATRVWGTMAGIGHLPGFPFLDAQSFGAWFCLGVSAIWLTRKFIARQVRAAFAGARSGGGASAVQTRAAIIGLVIGAVFLLLFFRSTGTPIFSTLGYFTLFFALAIAITRIRAEVGPPAHDVPWRPDKVLVSFFGTRRIGAEGLTTFSMFHGFNRSYRSHPMPIMLEGFKVAQVRGLSENRLIIAVVLVTVVGTVSSAWAFYAQGYHYGAAVYGEQAQCRWTYEQLKQWLINPQSVDVGAVSASGGAMALTTVLMLLRRRFIWWPFHPAGYALSLSFWNTSWYWFSIFLSWALKAILFQVGGLRTYRRAMPFFIGLVIGEFVVGAIWTLIGIALERPMYRFMF